MRSGSRGFTLVEVMVSLVLLSIVMGSLFAGVIVISRAQSASAGVVSAQAGARGGFELLSRDLRMAAAGTTDATVFSATGSPAVQPTITITDSTTGPDRIDLVLLDPTAQTNSTASFGAGGSTLSVADASGFQSGDNVLVTDFNGALLLNVVSVTGGASPSLVVTAPTNALPRSWPGGSFVFRVRYVSYFVDATTFGPNEQLLMYDPDGAAGPQPPQPLVDGVEDLQIALGFDLNGDGKLSSVGAVAGDDEWIYNVAGETPPASMSTLKSIRLTIVTRPVSSAGGVRGRRPAAEDHPGAQATDGYPRRVLTSEIAVRNFNL